MKRRTLARFQMLIRMPVKSPLDVTGSEVGALWYQRSALRGTLLPVLWSITVQESISSPSSIRAGKSKNMKIISNMYNMNNTLNTRKNAKYAKYVWQLDHTVLTLYSFAQQWTGFLVQGMQHHTQLCLRPLIGADTLLFYPDLVGLFGSVTTYIDSITIACNISTSMSHTVILPRGSDWIAMSIGIWKHNLTVFQVPEVCTVCKICNI